MSEIRYELTPESERALSSITEGLLRILDGAVNEAALYAEEWMSDVLRGTEYAGDLRMSIEVRGPVTTSTSVTRFVGPDLSKTQVPDEDLGPKSRSPYSYAFARHFPGHDFHRVYLYATTSRARKKLQRWVGDKWRIYVPPTVQEFRKMNPDVSPFIEVDPSRTATDYVTGVLSDKRNSQIREVILETAIDLFNRGGWM